MNHQLQNRNNKSSKKREICHPKSRPLMERNISVSQENTDIPKDLECSICGEIFDKAVSLKACGHTYCSVCIRNHWLTTSLPGIHRQSKKECPLCRAAIGHDVNKALVINRAIQEAVKAFKPASPPPLTKIGSYANEFPIKKRIQSRNYAGMKRNGKKELQKICKEYNLSTSGNEQDLVDRLRCFECMWNSELDTIDTPLKPSEVVAKFKMKERMQREEKSRDIMTGKINDSKYMKKLTSSLLDNENKRNDKTVSETSSGNATFDAKFKSNFAELIAQGRRRMKKESYWSSPRKSACLRTYADDGIHDSPQRNANVAVSCNDQSNAETSAVKSNTNSPRTPGDDVTKIQSSVGGQSSQNKKRHIYNPYKSQRQHPSVHTTTKTIQSSVVGVHIPNKHTTAAQSRPLPSAKETPIHNPYKKKRLLVHQTPSPGSTNSHNMQRGNFNSKTFPLSSEFLCLQNSRRSDAKCRDAIPHVRANILTKTTNIHRNKIDDRKIPRLPPTEVGVASNYSEMKRTNSARKKIIRNPYYNK